MFGAGGGLSGAAKQVLVKINGDASGYKKALGSAEKQTDEFSSKLAGFGRAATFAFVGASAAAIGYSVKAAIGAEGVTRAFHVMVGNQDRDVDAYLAKLKVASAGTISETNIMTTANKAMMMGLDLDTIETMMEGARTIAIATGQNVGYLFESLSMGVARQSRLLLDNLGIIVSAEVAYQNYADSLDRTVASLSESEKKIAYQKEVMTQLDGTTKELAGDTPIAAQEIQKFQASIDNLATSLGTDLLPAITETLLAVNEWGEDHGFELVADGFRLMMDGVSAFTTALSFSMNLLGIFPEAYGKFVVDMETKQGATWNIDEATRKNAEEFDEEYERLLGSGRKSGEASRKLWGRFTPEPEAFAAGGSVMTGMYRDEDTGELIKINAMLVAELAKNTDSNNKNTGATDANTDGLGADGYTYNEKGDRTGFGGTVWTNKERWYMENTVSDDDGDGIVYAKGVRPQD